MQDARSLLDQPEHLFPGSETLAALFALVADQSDPRYLRLVTSMVARIPELRTQLQELICLAEEAGISHEGASALLSAVVLNDQLDQLLAQGTGQSATAILDPEEVRGIDYRALARLARARRRFFGDEVSKARFDRVIGQLEAEAAEWERRQGPTR